MSHSLLVLDTSYNPVLKTSAEFLAQERHILHCYFFTAAYLGDTNTARRLIKRGVDLNVCVESIPSSLLAEYAPYVHHYVRETPECANTTALQLAIVHRHLMMLTLLLKAGCNIHTTHFSHQSTPLMLAVDLHSTPFVLVLLKAGSCVSTKNAFGLSALSYAASSVFHTLTQLLLYFSDPPIPPFYMPYGTIPDSDPLVQAFLSGSVDTVVLLLRHGYGHHPHSAAYLCSLKEKIHNFGAAFPWVRVRELSEKIATLSMYERQHPDIDQDSHYTRFLDAISRTPILIPTSIWLDNPTITFIVIKALRFHKRLIAKSKPLPEAEQEHQKAPYPELRQHVYDYLTDVLCLPSEHRLYESYLNSLPLLTEPHNRNSLSNPYLCMLFSESGIKLEKGITALVKQLKPMPKRGVLQTLSFLESEDLLTLTKSLETTEKKTPNA